MMAWWFSSFVCAAASSCCRLMELIEDACDPGIFGQQFFYSYGTDITLTQQRFSAVHEDPTAAGKPQWARADSRFFWNKYLTQPLIGQLSHAFIVCPSQTHVKASRPSPIAVLCLLLQGASPPEANSRRISCLCNWEAFSVTVIYKHAHNQFPFWMMIEIGTHHLTGSELCRSRRAGQLCAANDAGQHRRAAPNAVPDS